MIFLKTLKFLHKTAYNELPQFYKQHLNEIVTPIIIVLTRSTTNDKLILKCYDFHILVAHIDV